jgi:glycine betaine/proline transport system permease protein
MENFRDWIDIGGGFESIVRWLQDNLDWLFSVIAGTVNGMLDGSRFLLTAPPAIVTILVFAAIAWYFTGKASRCSPLSGLALSGIWAFGRSR